MAAGPIERRVRECVLLPCRYTLERVPSDAQMRKYYQRTGEKKEKKATGSRTWVNSFEQWHEGGANTTAQGLKLFFGIARGSCLRLD